jgi:hypothetical protein
VGHHGCSSSKWIHEGRACRHKAWSTDCSSLVDPLVLLSLILVLLPRILMLRHRNELSQAHTTGERSRWIGDPTDESIGMERIVLQIILLVPICSTRASASSFDAKRNVNPRARAWSEGRAQPTNHPITFSIPPPRTPLFVWIDIGLLLALDFPLEYHAVAGSHVCQRHPSFNRFPKVDDSQTWQRDCEMDL